MGQPHILITGGAGYIGSHTAKAVAGAGLVPVVFDNLSNGHRDAVLWGPFVHGDVRDKAALHAAMVRHRISGVIHFAGRIEVGVSAQAPDVFWDHNLNGVAATLAAMRSAGVRRIVFSSTAAVYGQPGSPTPLRESDPTLPINPYGDTKLAGERLIAASCAAYGLEGVALRYFNAAGADPDGRVGEAHGDESHLIPLAIEAALGLREGLTLHGVDFPTADGTCVRDYVHVDDLASAHLLALHASLPSNAPFLAANLGAGRGYSVREIIQAVTDVVGCAPPVTEGPRRAGDPAVLIADIAGAAEVLNWRPRISSLGTIIETAVAWRRSPAFGFGSNDRAGIDRVDVRDAAPVRVDQHGATPDLNRRAVG
jgi:UDP-glucose-4-epimerase GalE